ncbi:uncharacterized protein LOC128957113 [Oppia nitens]|uniref:uncharacterized protein LOC128957113 n=1 Tax=Oppia nitens TaxID=1686743 RepID=UPI0023DA74C7|nr:uncharacterized protein LOC128957113 [Oppia nitens]
MKFILVTCLLVILINNVICPYSAADCKTKEQFEAKAKQLIGSINAVKPALSAFSAAHKDKLTAPQKQALDKVQSDLNSFTKQKESLMAQVKSGQVSVAQGCEKAIAMSTKLAQDIQQLQKVA